MRPGALLRLRLPPSLTALRLGGLDAATQVGELQKAGQQAEELQEAVTRARELQEGAAPVEELGEASGGVSPMQSLVAACRMLAGRFRQGQEEEGDGQEEDEGGIAAGQGQMQGPAGALAKEAAGAQVPDAARSALERSPFCVSVPRRPEPELGSEEGGEDGEGQLGVLAEALAPLGLRRLALFADRMVRGVRWRDGVG